MWYTPPYKMAASQTNSCVNINAITHGNMSNQKIWLRWYAQQLNNWNFTIKALMLTLLAHIRFYQEAPWSSNFMVITTQQPKNSAGKPALPFYNIYTIKPHISINIFPKKRLLHSLSSILHTLSGFVAIPSIWCYIAMESLCAWHSLLNDTPPTCEMKWWSSFLLSQAHFQTSSGWVYLSWDLNSAQI